MRVAVDYGLGGAYVAESCRTVIDEAADALIDSLGLRRVEPPQLRWPSLGTAWSLAGLGTFLAVFLHKPLDAMSITSLMAASG